VKIMPWNTLRLATNEDHERLEAAARRYADRHRIRVALAAPDTAVAAVEEHLYDLHASRDPDLRAAYYRRLWRDATRRALRDRRADGIAYGYVGYHTD
jgi:hypothetical protein